MEPQGATTRDFDQEADRRLIRDVAGGSAEALGRLYDRHAGTVFALARRIVPAIEDAEEVVQDVFSQVWRDAARYESSRAPVAGWVAMLARTRAIDRLRARRARPDSGGLGPDATVLPLAASGADPERQAIAATDVQAVRLALGALPAPQRELVELAYFQGLTHTELAERTGTPLGTVKTRLRSALATLRGALSS
ncbi:MAG: sigma-70 family RNA polymerase sigma factor [Vicinamibacterales bacterium]